ncbi:LytTR family DNA-binding domain-containing protein [Paucilactobacillus suebicus]|uniref:Response regulator n=1 Tax=Paucilactobacillus suebicus DSM 5007 = KCTC 3549 TaxID=1423807 RepID=A0A0R1VW07_9LACO|nr:LytTR family DNA-binding domain-containing protein [Paucilactobacillus suebicus]KRM09904.1 response regulator [Paucilactobacillus suebicus DSM 5007 = KCTC 3549]
MKVKLEIDAGIQDSEVIIRAPKYDADIQQIQDLIQQQNAAKESFEFYKGATQYYLEIGSIMFFETEDRQVLAHTATDVYNVHLRLYELEQRLPIEFIRVSKSAIVNVSKILALTKSLSNCLIQFENSPKEIYASRKYYRPLQDRLRKMR